MSKRDRQAVAQGLNDVFGGSDLLGNVIQGDRSRRRTPQSPPSSAPVVANTDNPSVIGQTGNMTDIHYDNLTNVPYDNVTDKPEDTQASVQPDKPSTGQTDNGTDIESAPRQKEKPKRRQSGAALIETRIREGQEMAKSPTVTVTLRLPSQMNAWLDEYVHGSWPLKVRKQELVAEALRMLYARRGRPGETVVNTELLEEESES